jgi:hypothetical protein
MGRGKTTHRMGPGEGNTNRYSGSKADSSAAVSASAMLSCLNAVLLTKPFAALTCAVVKRAQCIASGLPPNSVKVSSPCCLLLCCKRAFSRLQTPYPRNMMMVVHGKGLCFWQNLRACVFWGRGCLTCENGYRWSRKHCLATKPI